jgi:hypothetical protein
MPILNKTKGMDFNQFKKNPISAIAFMMILGVGYLYYDMRIDMGEQNAYLKGEIELLKEENKELQDKYIELARSIHNSNH